MRKIWTIAVREYKAYLASPIGYAIAFLFLLGVGILSLAVILYTAQAALRIVFHNIAVVLLFVTTAITMRLFSEERRLRTIELLMTNPVTETQVVIGKYLGAILFLFTLLLPTLVYYGFIEAYGSPDKGATFVGYIGVFLVGATFASIGVMTSAATSSQAAAALSAFFLLLILWIIEWLSGRTGGALSNFLTYISVYDHLDEFMRGVLDSRGVVYFLSMIFLSLFATTRIINATKWRV